MNEYKCVSMNSKCLSVCRSSSECLLVCRSSSKCLPVYRIVYECAKVCKIITITVNTILKLYCIFFYFATPWESFLELGKYIKIYK